MKNSNVQRRGFIIGSISIAANLVLFALKYWAGVRTGSVAMAADSWHTLSDTLTSLVVILGFWMAGIPKDREHPFGHGRAEGIGAIVIGTILAILGVEFIRESFHHLTTRDVAALDAVSVIIFGVSAILKESMARISIYMGKKTGSQSLIADGWHHRSDAFASGLVLVGLFFGKRIWWIDGVLGIVVSVLIIYTSWEIIKDASMTILGERPPDDLVDCARRYVRESLPVISEIHNITYHRYGDYKVLTLHAVMPDDIPLTESHRLATILEREIMNRFGIVATVHMEPESNPDPEE